MFAYSSTDLRRALHEYWKALYGQDSKALLTTFINRLIERRKSIELLPNPPLWHKHAVIYSLYVDLFNDSFEGLIEKLPYLEQLGVNTLWLLPILESPLRDQGFDVSDYRRVRRNLFRSDEAKHDLIFSRFVKDAHNRGLRLIFDLPVNHTSDEHLWFVSAKSSPLSPYRDYYYWTTDPSKEFDPPPLFIHFYKTNWTRVPGTDYYYFHRFFDFQPDLNYRNPKVLLEMAEIMLYWLERGIDGFRLDAIPFLWKEKGTDCTNLPQVHTIIRFLRTAVEFVRPNTLFLAEAGLPMSEAKQYFGKNGEECNAAYHFDLVMAIFKSMAFSDKRALVESLTSEDLANGGDYQWFLFLRSHDELNFEMAPVSEQKLLYETYCHDPRWDFKNGRGIAARLADLLENDEERISLAFSILLTLPGSPIIFYGDEYGKTNDYEFYEQMKRLTGVDDRRYLARGKMEWDKIEQSTLYHRIKPMIVLRRNYSEILGLGSMQWLELNDLSTGKADNILAFYREKGKKRLLILHNLSSQSARVRLPVKDFTVLQGNSLQLNSGILQLKPYGFYWLEL